jgi:hypothetical protein
VDYDPPSYNARVQLALMDHNENCSRPVIYGKWHPSENFLHFSQRTIFLKSPEPNPWYTLNYWENQKFNVSTKNLLSTVFFVCCRSVLYPFVVM